jgi:hypothetical protein
MKPDDKSIYLIIRAKTAKISKVLSLLKISNPNKIKHKQFIYIS